MPKPWLAIDPPAENAPAAAVVEVGVAPNPVLAVPKGDPAAAAGAADPPKMDPELFPVEAEDPKILAVLLAEVPPKIPPPAVGVAVVLPPNTFLLAFSALGVPPNPLKNPPEEAAPPPNTLAPSVLGAAAPPKIPPAEVAVVVGVPNTLFVADVVLAGSAGEQILAPPPKIESALVVDVEDPKRDGVVVAGAPPPKMDVVVVFAGAAVVAAAPKIEPPPPA